MGKPIQPRTLEMCAIYKRRLAEGDPDREIVGDLAREFRILRAAVRKALRSGGALPPYQPQEDAEGRPAGRARIYERRASDDERMANLRPAVAEPCGRCGVRADLGCRHQPAQGLAPIALAEEPRPARPRSNGQGWSLHKDRIAGGIAFGLAQLSTRVGLNDDTDQS